MRHLETGETFSDRGSTYRNPLGLSTVAKRSPKVLTHPRVVDNSSLVLVFVALCCYFGAVLWKNLPFLLLHLKQRSLPLAVLLVLGNIDHVLDATC